MKQALGERIKHYRKRKGITQAQLSDILNLDKSTPFRWERGISWPDYNQLLALAEALDVRPENFFETVTGQPPQSNHSIETLAAEVDRLAVENSRLNRELAQPKASNVADLTGPEKTRQEIIQAIKGLPASKLEQMKQVVTGALEQAADEQDRAKSKARSGKAIS